MLRKTAVFILVLFCSQAAYAEPVFQPTKQQATTVLNRVHATLKSDRSGKVADYIPALAKANPEHFGIVIANSDGLVVEVGDTRVPFAIESISKVFALALAFEDVGRQAILDNVGVYHTGLPFNSLLGSEIRQVKQQNPFVNVGAIATTSMIKGKDSEDKWNRELNKFNLFAGRKLSLNNEVDQSEMATNQHNKALAWQYKSYGLMSGDPIDATTRYTSACSVNVTCRDLAIMGACLANDGVNPITGKRAVQSEYVRDILSVMSITGLYDSTGPFFFHTGLPGKSGVGGGIIAVVPGRFAIATFSPPLDKFGNSVRGMKAVEALSKEWELHMLNPR